MTGFPRGRYPDGYSAGLRRMEEGDPRAMRILLIGNGGSGKSRLSRELNALTGLPLIHLDAHYWQPGWQPTPTEAWEAKVDELMARERWIMDGNYGGTLVQRARRAHLIVLFDLPVLLCAWRVTKRRWRWRGRTRPDAGTGNPEKADFEFFRWILNFRRRTLPRVLRKLREADALDRTIRVRRDGDLVRVRAQCAKLSPRFTDSPHPRLHCT